MVRPVTNGSAIHRNRDDFILFDTPGEAILCRFVMCARDIQILPLGHRDGISFIVDELNPGGWVSCGTAGMGFHSYRPGPAVGKQYRDAFASTGMGVADGCGISRDDRLAKADFRGCRLNYTSSGLICWPAHPIVV